MVDFTQFFNPSAWGSWAPSGTQGMVSPQVVASPNAPSPAGAPVAPPPAPAPAQGQAPGGQNGWNQMLQKAATMVQPAKTPVPPLPPIQMAKPVGPGQMGMLNGAL